MYGKIIKKRRYKVHTYKTYLLCFDRTYVQKLRRLSFQFKKHWVSNNGYVEKWLWSGLDTHKGPSIYYVISICTGLKKCIKFQKMPKSVKFCFFFFIYYAYVGVEGVWKTWYCAYVIYGWTPRVMPWNSFAKYVHRANVSIIFVNTATDCDLSANYCKDRLHRPNTLRPIFF